MAQQHLRDILGQCDASGTASALINRQFDLDDSKIADDRRCDPMPIESQKNLPRDRRAMGLVDLGSNGRESAADRNGVLP